MSIEIVVVMKSVANAREKLLELLVPLAKTTLEEAGCESFAVHRELDVDDNIILVERWRGQHDIDAHMNFEYTKKFIELSAPLIDNVAIHRLSSQI